MLKRRGKKKARKRLLGLALLTLIVMTIPTSSQAVEWKPTNQATIAWDASTMKDNKPVPQGFTVAYNIYIAREKSSGEYDDVNFTKLNTTPVEQTEYIITLPEPGKWIVGVDAYLIDEKKAMNGEFSGKALSINPEHTGGKPFGLLLLVTVNPPNNIVLK